MRLTAEIPRLVHLVNAALSLALLLHLSGRTDLELFRPVVSEEDYLSITVEEAWEGFQSGRYIFVDARERSAFTYAHIPGAWSVPAQERTPSVRVLSEIRQAPHPIVIYCDGGKCGASKNLARRLVAQGVGGIRILQAGWEGWLAAGLPQEKKL